MMRNFIGKFVAFGCDGAISIMPFVFCFRQCRTDNQSGKAEGERERGKVFHGVFLSVEADEAA